MDLVLHGLWTPGSGLLLWQDRAVSDGDGLAGDGGEGHDDLPPFLARVMARRLRHTASVTMPAAAGAADRVEAVPAAALAPMEAADLLRRVPLVHPALSGDLRYLAAVTRGLERWARAGRVVPHQVRLENRWWLRWRLLGDEHQRGWRAELLAAMPPVQRAEGDPAVVLDDLIAELTDPVVRHVLGRPDVHHPLLVALVEEEPYEDGSTRSEQALDRWRDSLRGDDATLVLRLVEPDDLDQDLDQYDDQHDGGDARAAPDGENRTPSALWRLQVLVRPDGEAPQPVSLRPGAGVADTEKFRGALRALAEAAGAYPPLARAVTAPGSVDLLLPTEMVLDFVVSGVRAVQSVGVDVLLPREWARVETSMRLTVDAPPSPTTKDSAVGLDRLVEYDWQVAVGDMVLSAEEMARLASSKADLVRVRGKWVHADGAVLARAIDYVERHRAPTSVPLASALGQLAASEPPPVPVTDVAATGWVAALLDSDRRPEPVEIPSSVRATLRPYQERGVRWLAFMSSLGLGAILADDMGLGKTVQILVLLGSERAATPAQDRRPTLVVAPMSVVGNWAREAATFVPDLTVHVHHGAGRVTGEDLQAVIASSDVVVTTYALLARDVSALAAARWRRVVLDEAQHIKNSGTAQARAARAVPAEHRIALTGTPVENRLEELRSIVDFCNPGLLGGAAVFRARFAVPIEREGDQHALARLRSLTAPFVLRRVKTDRTVIADLPEKFEMTVRTNLTAEQASLYQAVVDETMRQIDDAEGMERKGAVLAALTRLKQVCNHPAHFLADGSTVLRRGRHRSGKVALVEDILDSVLADGEKALVFTQFAAFGRLVVPYLEDRFGVEVPFLHGGVRKRGRDEMVARFQSSDGPPILLATVKAGGTGLTLTAANHVVHLDRWWNPAVENQATDRAFRIGQRRDVQVRKLVCVGTVEERIDEILTGKAGLADMAVGAGENWITELSTGELRSLLSLSDEAVGE
ncbi:DEAD/DEAH box helicase [Rhodococcoides corynebacterioides]|uniref:DEAD/DEAH box helicase n=1 Tax=Rhodococcoides corynebacterioides TaxID=53972 RepID=A0ABS7P8U8_9NOCA|nr:DEAD/DEAH box helicase [Rhodococcus corynebacterioides]MBY6368471.1 DEAD/DEAH box helicase [Rhodococcus corynebacterioides]MBY6409885.1 DEAD/DEAH box helicase [Rhodococcus corynebacterioides]